jgi:hypothetical protein
VHVVGLRRDSRGFENQRLAIDPHSEAIARHPRQVGQQGDPRLILENVHGRHDERLGTARILLLARDILAPFGLQLGIHGFSFS